MATDERDAEKYLLTCDLGLKLAYLRQSGLLAPDPEDFLLVSIQNRLIADLQAALAPCDLISIHMSKLSVEILSAIHAQGPLAQTLIVSTCPEIRPPAHSVHLEINRVYSLEGRKLGLGPRPGHPPLREQLSSISVLAREKRVVLVEDGIFSGSTIRATVELLRARHIHIDLIVAGFAFAESRSELERLESEGIQVTLVHQFGRLRDWMPDHDFFPFVPGSGRVVGVNPFIDGVDNDHLLPLYSYNQATYAFPYLQPFTRDPEVWEDWTGIDRVSAREFSQNRMADAYRLFEHLEALNGRQIRLGDIMHAQQRVSIPVGVGQRAFPSLDMRILDFLTQNVS